MPPVYKYMDLSTAHLRRSTVEALTNAPAPAPCRVIADEYGMWCSVPTTEALEDMEDNKRLEWAAWPDLWWVLMYAKAHDCYWVRFDRDAEREPSLLTWDW